MNSDTPAAILYYNYLIEKAERHLEKALDYMEQYYEVYDSVKSLENSANLVNVEKRYNHLKISMENATLHSDMQRMLISLMFVVVLFLCLFVLYFVRINQKDKQLSKQQYDLLKKDKILSQLKNELIRKQDELAIIMDHNQQDNGDILNDDCLQKKREVDALAKKIKEQQYELLQLSPIGQKVIKLSKKVIPNRNESPLLKQDWQDVFSRIDEIYPLLKERLFDYGMTDKEISYCYLSFFMLDANSEAVLLNINPDSVNKTRQRIRRKLGILGENLKLPFYLAELC